MHLNSLRDNFLLLLFVENWATFINTMKSYITDRPFMTMTNIKSRLNFR